jgi:hypothetical protein
MPTEPSPDPFTQPGPNDPKPTEPSTIPIVTDVPEQLPPEHGPIEEPTDDLPAIGLV